MTRLSVFVNSADLSLALAAVAPWRDPKADVDAWQRYRLILAEDTALALATNGVAAACASLPVLGLAGDTADLPVIVDLTPSQTADVRHVFKPRSKATDDTQAGEELRLDIIDAADSDTGEATRDLTITEAGGLWEGTTYTTQLPAIDPAFPRVVALLAGHLATRPTAGEPVAILPAAVLKPLTATAVTLKAELHLERVTAHEHRGTLLARIGDRFTAVLTEYRGNAEEQEAAQATRMTWDRLVHHLANAEPDLGDAIVVDHPDHPDPVARLEDHLARMKDRGITVEVTTRPRKEPS